MEGILKIPSSNSSAVGRDTFHQIRLIKAISKYNLPKYFFFQCWKNVQTHSNFGDCMKKQTQFLLNPPHTKAECTLSGVQLWE